MDLSQQHFEFASQHHAKVAKRFHKAVKIAQGGMSKVDADPADILDEVLQEILAIASTHEEMSEHCSKCAKAAGEEAMERAERADRDRFSATIVDDGVRKVTPTVPRQGFTAVTRAGQPPIREQSKVDVGLAKVAGLNNEDLHSEETSLQRL